MPDGTEFDAEFDPGGFDFPNAATPPGGTAYYVVRFAAAGQRDALARLYAWRAELRHIVERANDPGVARLKLDWWRAELERAAAGEARHPLAQALAGLLRSLPDPAPFQRMLDVAELEIRRVQPNSEDELLARLARSGGAFAELSLYTAGNAAAAPTVDAAIRERARRLGAYEAAVRMLRDLYPCLRRDFCPLPLAAMGRHELRAGRLGEADQQRRLADYSRELVGRLNIASDLHGKVPGARSALLAARRSAALAAALNRKLARRGYPLMRERVELSPIENLWTAWRLR